MPPKIYPEYQLTLEDNKESFCNLLMHINLYPELAGLKQMLDKVAETHLFHDNWYFLNDFALILELSKDSSVISIKYLTYLYDKYVVQGERSSINFAIDSIIQSAENNATSMMQRIKILDDIVRQQRDDEPNLQLASNIMLALRAIVTNLIFKDKFKLIYAACVAYKIDEIVINTNITNDVRWLIDNQIANFTKTQVMYKQELDDLLETLQKIKKLADQLLVAYSAKISHTFDEQQQDVITKHNSLQNLIIKIDAIDHRHGSLELLRVVEKLSSSTYHRLIKINEHISYSSIRKNSKENSMHQANISVSESSLEVSEVLDELSTHNNSPNIHFFRRKITVSADSQSEVLPKSNNMRNTQKLLHYLEQELLEQGLVFEEVAPPFSLASKETELTTTSKDKKDKTACCHGCILA